MITELFAVSLCRTYEHPVPVDDLTFALNQYHGKALMVWSPGCAFEGEPFDTSFYAAFKDRHEAELFENWVRSSYPYLLIDAELEEVPRLKP